MAFRSPRDPSRPHPRWNAPIGRRGWRLKGPQPRQRSTIPKRTRAKIRRRLKRRFELNRRDAGMIGAGDLEAPAGYAVALRAEVELARFRRSR